MSFGSTVVSFTVTSGWKRWYVVGAYMSPNNLPAVNQITYALVCGTEEGGELIVGDFNACL